MTTKVCPKCHVEKFLEDFYRNKSRKDGRSPQCKACAKAYREENKDKIAARDKAYREANKEARKEQAMDHDKAMRDITSRTAFNHGQPWTQADEDFIVTWKGDRLTLAIVLGRTHSSVRYKKSEMRKAGIL